MSDYKEIETQVVIADREILIQVLSIVVGACAQGQEVDATISENVSVTNMFNHTHNVTMAIREEQLPEHLRGYGDIGIVEKNGKFVFLAIRPDESAYVDRRKGWEVGTFAAETEKFLHEVENAYGCLEGALKIQARCPGMTLGTVQGIADGEDAGAWGIAFSIPDEAVQRLTQRV